MGNSSASSDYLKKGLAEVARVGAAMVTLFTVLWFFGQPAAVQFVDDVIDRRKLASAADVTELKADMKEVKDEQTDVSKAIERQGQQIDNIEKLAAEGRAMQTQILLELRKP